MLCSWRTARRSPAPWPLMARSISNSASKRLTASSAIGETGLPFLPSRAFFSMSASSKKPRRAWAKQNAGAIGCALRLLLRVEQRLEATVAIGLQDAGEGGQMPLRMLASSVA